MTVVYVLLVVPAFVIGAIVLVRLDEQVAARVRRGKVELVRGRISPALLSDFTDVARRFPRDQGTIIVRARAGQHAVTTKGLPEVMTQRLRNVLALHGKRLARDASIAAKGPSRFVPALFGVSVVLAIVGLVGMQGSSEARFFGGTSLDHMVGAEIDANALAQAMREQGFSDEEEIARARPYVDKLLASGFLASPLGQAARFLSSSGPIPTLAVSTRAVPFPLSLTEESVSITNLGSLTRSFRAMGIPDAELRCTRESGCVLAHGSQSTEILSQAEAARAPGADPCTAARVLNRIASVLRAHPRLPPYQVVYAGEVEDEDAIWVVAMTEDERAVLTAWEASREATGGEPFGYTYPFEAAFGEACRDAR